MTMSREDMILLDCDIEKTEAAIVEMEETIQHSTCPCSRTMYKIGLLKAKLTSLFNTKMDTFVFF